MSRPNLVMGSIRELGTVTLVAGLSGCYAAALIMTSSMLGTASDNGGGMGVFLSAVSTVFILIALYVAAVVIANCVDTVIAGRLRQIALLRLLGASGRGLRRSVTRSTALAATIGAVLGIGVGTILALVVRVILVSRGSLPHEHYPLLSPGLLVALLAIVGCAAAAGRLGSRGVLRVSPSSAMSGAAATLPVAKRVSRLRRTLASLMILGGAGILLLAMLLGETSPGAGFVVAFFGAAISATGLLVGARFVIPAAVAGFSRLLGRDPASVLGRRNALADPLRTTRSTMGLIIGVTLVTTFAAGFTALRDSTTTWNVDAAQRKEIDSVLAMTSTVMICIVVISSIIAAVGFVSTMSLTVIQRGREIGLLRALGFTQMQVRSMITKESVALSATAVIFGIGLGLIYGTAGAQSLIGQFNSGLVWGLPWVALVTIAAAGLVLVLLASRGPARRAIAVAPIVALRIDN